jgi:hypothetical protein
MKTQSGRRPARRRSPLRRFGAGAHHGAVLGVSFSERGEDDAADEEFVDRIDAKVDRKRLAFGEEARDGGFAGAGRSGEDEEHWGGIFAGIGRSGDVSRTKLDGS